MLPSMKPPILDHMTPLKLGILTYLKDHPGTAVRLKTGQHKGFYVTRRIQRRYNDIVEDFPHAMPISARTIQEMRLMGWMARAENPEFYDITAMGRWAIDLHKEATVKHLTRSIKV